MEREINMFAASILHATLWKKWMENLNVFRDEPASVCECQRWLKSSFATGRADRRAALAGIRG